MTDLLVYETSIIKIESIYFRLKLLSISFLHAVISQIDCH